MFVAGVAVTLAAAPAAAWACEEPSGGGAAVSAGPGDEVPFEVPNTLEGAAYRVSLDGDMVASGTDPGGERGVSGSFTMPDAGSEKRRIPVTIAVSHAADKAAWSTQMKVDYVPKAQPPPPPKPDPEPAPAPTPAPSPTPASQTPPARAQPQPPVPLLVPAAPTAEVVVLGRRRGSARRGSRTPARAPSRAVSRRLVGRFSPFARRTARRGRGARAGGPRKPTTFRLGDFGLEKPKPLPPAEPAAPSLTGRVPDFGVPVAWRMLLAAAVLGCLLVVTLRALALGRARRRALAP